MNDTRFDQLFQLTSVISLIFQIAATTLIALLSLVVLRAVRRRLMAYWAVGWGLYALALVAIALANRSTPFEPELLFCYFFFEYAAILMIFAACRYTATDEAPRSWIWYLFVPAAILAVALIGPVNAFYWRFGIHTAVVGLLWAACLVGVWPALRRPDAGPGVRIVAVGLVLLSIDYLHHLPLALYNAAHHLQPSAYYYTEISLVDGMLEFVLGIGTLIVIVDKVRAELQLANFRLKLAHDRTEDALHTDPLTSVFSRYSFDATYGETGDPIAETGCAVVVDLDGLKNVNDKYGHAAGDAAIRAVADGLRLLVRHEDRVYRWGGDEFVIIMLGATADLVRRRLAGINETVNRALDPAHSNVGALVVSWGASEFNAGRTMKAAIAAADEAMYASKAARKGSLGGA